MWRKIHGLTVNGQMMIYHDCTFCYNHNMKSNQRGFGAVEVALIIVLVGIIGFTGWRVYSANKEVSELDRQLRSQSTTSPATKKQATQETNQSSVPAGWKEYANSQLGFVFSYPESWGEVTQTAANNPEGMIYQGMHYYFGFSKNPDFYVAVKSSDYQYTGPGKDAPKVNGFASYDAQRVFIAQGYPNAEAVKESADTYVYIYAEGFSGSLNVQGIKKLTKSPGLDFALSIPVQNLNIPTDAQPELFDGSASPKKYFTQDQIDTVVKFAENIKDL